MGGSRDGTKIAPPSLALWVLLYYVCINSRRDYPSEPGRRAPQGRN
jgi:hypothetical protein